MSRAFPYLPLALWLLVVLTACESERRGAIRVSAEQIMDDPGAYYRSHVTVSGEVDDVYSPNVFTIGGDDFGSELLVLSVDSIAAVAGRRADEPVRRNDIVQVTGTVRQFVQADIADEFGLDPGMVEDEYENRPAVIARSSAAVMSPILVTARGGAAAPPTEQEIETNFASAAGAEAGGLSGQPARFDDVGIAAMVGENSFWAVSEGADSLFVVLSEGAVREEIDIAADTAGGMWSIYGILRQIPPAGELAAAWDLNEATTQQLAAREVYLQAIYARRAQTQ